MSGGTAGASFSLSGVNAGSYAIEAAYSGGTGFNGSNNSAQSPAATLTVNAKTLTGSFTAANKEYDATTTAMITGRSLTGVVGTDAVSMTGGTATFADKNVGTNEDVNGTGFSLSGTDVGNYSLISSSLARRPASRRRGFCYRASVRREDWGATKDTLTFGAVDVGVIQGGSLGVILVADAPTAPAITRSGFTPASVYGSKTARKRHGLAR